MCHAHAGRAQDNMQWDRMSVDDHGSTTRVLFTEENSDEEF